MCVCGCMHVCGFVCMCIYGCVCSMCVCVYVQGVFVWFEHVYLYSVVNICLCVECLHVCLCDMIL